LQIIKRIEKGKGQKRLFSIIVPVLNNAKDLQRCIDSFAKQSFENKELIIVDGCSTDGTLEIIDKNSHIITKSISAKDNGVYAAFNIGVQMSQGEWLLFLGSDDALWADDVLSNVAQFIDKKWTGQKIVYGQVANLNEYHNLIAVKGIPWSSFQKNPIGEWSFHHQGIFNHRSLFEVHGLFDESFKIVGDHELLLRELKTGEALFLENIIVSGCLLDGLSARPRNVKNMYKERKKVFLLHNLLSERVATREMYCKIYIYESLRCIFGLAFADSIWLAYSHIKRALTKNNLRSIHK
jgi:glycosyltransferase involved in cell wall biosynthesis